MSILYLGGTIFIQEKFDELSVLETIEQERITYTRWLPSYASGCCAWRGLASFQNLVAPLSRHHRRPSFARTAPNIRREFVPSFTKPTLRLPRLRPDSRLSVPKTGHPRRHVGKPIWCRFLLRIASDDGREMPRGQEGEICVRTPLAIQGY